MGSDAKNVIEDSVGLDSTTVPAEPTTEPEPASPDVPPGPSTADVPGDVLGI
jgi:hypothetical protein